MSALSYEIQTQQTTGLTPRLQQAVRLLQMSSLDCNREIVEALASNPFLEDPADTDLSAQTPEPSTPDIDSPEPAHVTEESAIEFTECQPDETPASYSGDYPISSSQRPGESGGDIGSWAHTEAGLRESLRANLCGVEFSPREAALIHFIIDSLDDDGYLRASFSDLTQTGQFSPAPSDGEWKTALLLVQQLGLPGIGARDLAECLSLQLKALPDHKPARELALRIVERALEHLGRCDYAGIARLLACTEDEGREACALIRTLNPRPAASFTLPDAGCYVVADAVVRRVGKVWMAVPNVEAAPRVRLNDAYARMFRESRYPNRSLMSHALQEARWLVRSLEQRNATIQRVAQAIVARQQTFFDYGAIALRPLMLSEIAEELELHESTISRATSYKYLASPLGIFEFKHFFSRELATQSGGTCSATAVRALIREMIDGENPNEPLTDMALTSKLAREGVVIARRTVSKYRGQIKYPPAELRRTDS